MNASAPRRFRRIRGFAAAATAALLGAAVVLLVTRLYPGRRMASSPVA